MRTASLKVEGGKLVKLRLDEETGRVTIHGDFFIYPEETIHALEDLLSGMPSSTSHGEIISKMDALMEQIGARPLGFSSKDLACLYREVIDH